MEKIGLKKTGLILTRRPGESIMIGDNVEVTVSAINGMQVRVLINAPREVPVHRSEVYARIQEEKRVEALRQPKKETAE